MRTRTTFSIAVLAGAFVAVPLYFIARTDPVAVPASSEAAVTAAPPAGHTEAQNPYCMQRTAGDGVAISTGEDCKDPEAGKGRAAITVTTTHEHGAVVITGSDP